MTMGNSVAAWTKFYDRHFQRRECQAGIDTMRTWREQLLTQQTATLQLPSHNDNSEPDEKSETESESSELSSSVCSNASSDETESDVEMEQ